ncbi:class II aldolase/adducin family protein [Bradyrhizobium sp. 14AA]
MALSNRSPTAVRCSAQEWTARVDLAAAYRLMAHFGVSDLSYNHLSMRVPDAPDQFLVKPGDWMFDEVTASGLYKFSFDGTPHQDGPPCRGGQLVIHAGILEARRDINVVFHTHTTANTGVSAQKHGLLMLSQHAMGFYNRIAYHEFGGFEFNLDQQAPLLRDLAQYRYAMLRNHGALVCGENVPQTFVDHHYLEMACRAQIAALAGGAEVTIIAPDVCERAAQQYENIDPQKKGSKDWPACLRLLERLYPEFRA